MRLTELAGFVFDGAVAKIRREALAIVAAGACAVGALYQLAGASVLALEPYTGAAGARLIVALGFLLTGGVAIAIPRLYDRNRRSLLQQTETALPRPLPLAAILEAALLGFFLAGSSHGKKK
jgi:hypothetical protein